MTTAKGWLIGFGIFLYFVVTTAWLPSRLLTGPLAASSQFIQGAVTVTIWAVFLFGGMLALRTAQRRGMI